MPNTTMNSLRNSITEMGARIREAASALAVAANDESISMEEVQRQQAALRAMNERMNALQASYNAQFGENAGTLPTPPAMSASDERSLRDMLGSNEYARAFARAIRTGMRPGRGPSGEQDKILFDALTIAGGTTAGEDGGFLVPEDIDHNIRELRRELSPLADLFNNESVSSNSGWRVVDTAPTTGMTALASEVPTGGIAKDDQPKFAKVTYSLKTYGLIVPVSNELANDEVANLFGYLSRWFAKKQILTENLLLKAELEALTAGAITSADDPIASLKATLNKELDPAISAMAVILTNQDGFDYLDQKKDTTGRGLLQPDPTNPTSMLFKGRPVKMVANSLLPNRVVTTTGATKGDYLPIYVGDFKEFATLLTRQPLEVTSTDIGGNAFHTNSIEVRGITRLDASTFDSKAAVRKEIFIAAS